MDILEKQPDITQCFGCSMVLLRKRKQPENGMERESSDTGKIDSLSLIPASRIPGSEIHKKKTVHEFPGTKSIGTITEEFRELRIKISFEPLQSTFFTKQTLKWVFPPT